LASQTDGSTSDNSYTSAEIEKLFDDHEKFQSARVAFPEAIADESSRRVAGATNAGNRGGMSPELENF
jgi:hypothetical protein